MSSNKEFKLVSVRGAYSVHAVAYGETMHPAIGPAAEAEALYVQQLKLRDRIAAHRGEFVVWDIGLGAAANVAALLRCGRNIASTVRIISFDNTIGPLRFAVQNAATLKYLEGYEEVISQLCLGDADVMFTNGKQEVRWQTFIADFPKWLSNYVCNSKREVPSPDAILFDAFSPKKNPAMWTAPLFADLFQALDPARPCSLATYSRSTMFRAALLLAGFFVGAGHATGEKEETTIAANALDLVEKPLTRDWLKRAQVSTSAEPLWEPVYRQQPLTPETFEKLCRHPQFG